jgi:hypothetical protein
MREIFLSDEQSSVVKTASGPVQVYDRAGKVLGQLVPKGGATGARAVGFDPDRWIQCWNEWYFGTAEKP